MAASNPKLAGAALLIASIPAIAQVPPTAPPAAPDISAYVTPGELKALDERIRPSVDQARRTFAGARARFQAGLPRSTSLYATARLYDECGHSELAFIAVDAIDGGIIEGRVASKTTVVAKMYRPGDRYAFPEEQLMDWMIAGPTGGEGNVLARTLDARKPPQ